MNKRELLARIVALEELQEEPEMERIEIVFIKPRPGAEPGDWEGATTVPGFSFEVKTPPRNWKKLRRRRND